MTTTLELEIHEQPSSLARLIESQQAAVTAAAEAIRAFAPDYVVIAARGTSDNAARYAQYVWGIKCGLYVGLATPSVNSLYHASINFRRALVVGISQSGASVDIRSVVEHARSQGALTLSLTNDASSPLAQVSDHHIDLSAGIEKSVAATKTYTAELTAVAMLAAAFTGDANDHTAIAQVPSWAAQTLGLSAGIDAAPFTYMPNFAVIGRGYNYATAFEITLKVQELCYVTGSGYSEADFRHGPIAIIQPAFPAIAVAPSGATLPAMLDLLDKLGERQARRLVISDSEDALAKAEVRMPIPQRIPEWLTPIVSVIPGQVFALRLAHAKGHSVDQPRGLTKVTVTR
ncbi:MAG: SIS domain-containing protein [Chloroflexi bacterium]|nr:SIS domain-containing protein [Chloroflexota bacterium]